MLTAEHKRGDSFTFDAEWTDTDTGRDFSATTATAQLRDEADAVVEDLTVVMSDSAGVVTATVSATAAETALWSLGRCRLDVEFVDGTDVWSTPTITLVVVYDVTRAP